MPLESIVIVGAGVFGLSTALELAARGYTVTVLDRYLPPAVDGSSVDISRIVRFDYGDELYSRMGREAVEKWKSDFPDYFYQCGFVMLTDKTGFAYTQKSQDVDNALGKTIEEFPDAETLKKRIPRITARLEGKHGYYNPYGGWADAARSIRELARRCSLAGVSFVTGRRGTAQSLVLKGPRVVGVNVLQGPAVLGDRVILATGAWTNQLAYMGHATSASAQPVGFVQLTKDEAAKIQNMPVTILSNMGIFVFPPTPDTHVLKLARHGYGYATKVTTGGRTISSPQRDRNNAAKSFLPQDAEADLRKALQQLVPLYGDLPWSRLRLCWYSDTPEGDFIVDNHPDILGLFFATGGSGQ